MSPAKDKVLYVDDDFSARKIARFLLREHYDITVSHSWSDCMRCITQEGPFKVVISDWMMPVVNGTQLCELVEANDHRVIKIMLTAHRSDKLVIDAVNQGHIFRYLEKPANSKEVLRAVADAVQYYDQLYTPQVATA